MTNQEAIEKLKKFDFVGSNEDIEFLTALDMAIKALEQDELLDYVTESIEAEKKMIGSCHDTERRTGMRLIDADKLEYREIDEIGGEYNPYMGCSKEYINNQPLVDVNDLIVEKLEKIREELHETAEMHSNGRYYLHDEWIDEYIDKHISELKGEQE